MIKTRGNRRVVILQITLLLIALLAVAVGVRGWIDGEVSRRASKKSPWSCSDVVEYYEWRLGFRKNPPFRYYFDAIDQIRAESTILTDDGSQVSNEKLGDQ